MLTDFVVADLPRSPTAHFDEDVSLGVVKDVMDASRCDAVVVTGVGGEFRGVVLPEQVSRIAARAPTASLGEMPPVRVLQVEPHMTLAEAMMAFNEPGLTAVVHRCTQGWCVVLRGALLSITSWEPLAAARRARLTAG